MDEKDIIIEELKRALNKAIVTIDNLREVQAEESSNHPDIGRSQTEVVNGPSGDLYKEFVSPDIFREYLKNKIGKTIYFRYHVESKNKTDDKFRKKKLIYYNKTHFTVQKKKGTPVSTYRIERVVDFK